METLTGEIKDISIKNACIEFMFAYQQKNLTKMISYCDPDGLVEFIPTGDGGKEKSDN